MGVTAVDPVVTWMSLTGGSGEAIGRIATSLRKEVETTRSH